MLSNREFSDAALKKAKIYAKDFEKTIRTNLSSSSFFFLDPPYAVKRRAPFTEYGRSSFDARDLNRLLECLIDIDDTGGRFAITYDVALAKLLRARKKWTQKEIVVRRNISGFAEARRNATEILTLNFG